MKKKLSFKEQREFDGLPAVIDELERSIAEAEAELAGSEIYLKGAAAIHDVLARLERDRVALVAAYARWDELDSRVPRIGL